MSKKWGGFPAPVALITFIVGVAAIVAAAVFFIVRQGDQNKVEANAAIPFAARVDRLDGEIGIARQTGSQEQPYQGWTEATVNAPVSLGDRIHVREGSKAAIAFSTRNYARLNPNTSIDVVSLTPRHTQLALREGAAVFDVGALAPDEVFEIGTPNGAVDFTEPGLYQVGIDDGGDTVVSVLNGTANCVDDSGSVEVSKGQLLTLTAEESDEAIIAELEPEVAGPIVDDYYAYRYPETYDHRYADYDAYEEDPYYYDQTYRRSASYQYIPVESDIAGLEDLDYYGDWVDVPNYGHCWRPRNISADWAPYRDGYWSNNYTVGLTWVSNERWGWAPYHYGRWARVNQGWFWVPTDVRQPVYAPALVAFVSLPRADEIGWVPLGPGDPYVPRYYDRDYQPHYVGSRDYVDRYVNVTNLVNYHDAAAVTVVSVTQFTQVITPATVLRPDAAYLASARPVVEPMAVPVVRQLAPTIEASRPTVAVPVEVQQVVARPIVLRQQPVAPPVATNIAETLKVQPVPEEATKRKLKTRNIGQPAVATNPNGLPAVTPEAKLSQMNDQERQARIAALQVQANQGNKAAKRELRQFEEQQRQQAAQQALAQQQQQAEQRKAEKQAALEQAQQAKQQRQAQLAQEAEQRKAQKQAARQQTQQAEQQRQAQLAQQAEQRKAQKQATRQQAQQAEQQRQQQAAQQAEQRKAEKRAARQQQPAQTEQQRQQQAAQQAEQRRAQKEAARQQAQQAEQQRQAELAEQQKAQKQAARQQAQAEQQRQQQAAQQAEQRRAQKEAARQQAQQIEQQRQQQANQQAAQQAEQRRAQKEAARQQTQLAEQQRQAQAAQQAEQQRQAQAAQQAEQQKAQKRAAQEQAQQQAARQQAQEEQRKVQKQAQQQAQQQEQQQRQQQKAEKRAERPQPEQQQEQQQRQQQKAEKRAERAQPPQQSQPQQQPNPNKEERKAEKAKNKNKNGNP